MTGYWHLVTVDAEEGESRFARLYQGTDHADAMAAWSKGIQDGNDYVVLESLKDRPQSETTGG